MPAISVLRRIFPPQRLTPARFGGLRQHIAQGQAVFQGEFLRALPGQKAVPLAAAQQTRRPNRVFDMLRRDDPAHAQGFAVHERGVERHAPVAPRQAAKAHGRKTRVVLHALHRPHNRVRRHAARFQDFFPRTQAFKAHRPGADQRIHFAIFSFISAPVQAFAHGGDIRAVRHFKSILRRIKRAAVINVPVVRCGGV